MTVADLPPHIQEAIHWLPPDGSWRSEKRMPAGLDELRYMKLPDDAGRMLCVVEVAPGETIRAKPQYRLTQFGMRALA